MNNKVAIKVENLTKIYKLYNSPIDRMKEALSLKGKIYHNDFYALNDISFEIMQGDTIGIVGRNGSGKSSLLKLITGITKPSQGNVVVNGRVSALLELGAGFNPEYTGIENIYFQGVLMGYDKLEMDNKFEEIIDFADIGEHINQPVKTYSSGMLVRLAFAIQSIVEPEIFIVDEALAVGDALFQKKCFKQLEKLRNKGITLLFVSHDQESVRTLTNKAILLKEGTLVAYGNSSDILLAYRKQLHEEETAWFTHLAKQTQHAKSQHYNKNVSTKQVSSQVNELDRFSFGDSLAVINKVELYNSENELNHMFYPQEKVKLIISGVAVVDLTHLNIGFRIRNKEGIKIYSWGTLNHDISLNAKAINQPLFWDKKFIAGEEFSIAFEFNCSLGVNFYEIQACLSYEGALDYSEQRILHWKDEAAFFQVQMKQQEYFFGGCNDLQATYSNNL